MALPVPAESEPPVILTSLPPPAELSLAASFPTARVLLVPTAITAVVGEGEAVAPEGAPQKLDFPPTLSRVRLTGEVPEACYQRPLCSQRLWSEMQHSSSSSKDGGGWRREMDTRDETLVCRRGPLYRHAPVGFHPKRDEPRLGGGGAARVWLSGFPPHLVYWSIPRLTI